MPSRIEDITSTFKQIEPLIKRANSLLGMERVSYELIRGDTESALMQKQRALEEKQIIEQQNNATKSEGQRIKDTLVEEGKKYLETQQKLCADAIALLDEVKDFCKGIGRKKFQELKDKAAA